MTNTALFMNLIKCRLQNPVCHPAVSDNFSSEEAAQMLHLARKHSLIPIVGSQLLNCNASFSQEFLDSLQEEVCSSLCYYEILNHELQWLKDILEDSHIPHMVLKGSVIRKYYPEPWLRTSGDIDILVKEDMLEEAISVLSAKGCTPENDRRYHDVPMRTPGNILLELHFNICEDIEILDQTLDRVWDYSQLVPGKKYEYQQTKEFFLFHLLAHMSYHLIHGGCGIRSFIDIWLVHQKEHLKYEVVQELLTRSRLTEFYHQVMALIGVWFEGKPHNKNTQMLQEFIIDGGTFGTREKEILIEQSQAGNKSKHFFYRIIMPYRLIKKQYPILNQYPILLPCCQVCRWFRILTGNRKKALKEIQAGVSHSDAQIQSTQQLLKQMGLNF